MNFVHVIAAICYLWFFIESYRTAEFKKMKIAYASIIALMVFCIVLSWYFITEFSREFADVYYGVVGVLVAYLAYSLMQHRKSPKGTAFHFNARALMVFIILAVILANARLTLID